MNPIAKLFALIGIDTKGLDGDIKKVENKFAGLGKRLAGAFSVIEIAQFARQSVALYGEQEAAVAKVQSALETMGTFGVDALGDMKRAASELQSASLFGDEEILDKVTAQLLTFGNVGQDSFGRAQRAIVDMAAHLGGDLKSASIQVGKALNDPIRGVTALADVGVSFTKQQRDTIRALAETGRVAEAQAIILGELENQYGGTAAAMAATGTGPMVQLRNSFNNLREEIGLLVADGIMPLVAWLKEATDWFTKLDDATRRGYTGLGLITGAALGITAAFNPVAGIITGVSLAMLTLATNSESTAHRWRFAWADLLADTIQEVRILSGYVLPGVSQALKAVEDRLRTIASVAATAANNIKDVQDKSGKIGPPTLPEWQAKTEVPDTAGGAGDLSTFDEWLKAYADKKAEWERIMAAEPAEAAAMGMGAVSMIDARLAELRTQLQAALRAGFEAPETLTALKEEIDDLLALRTVITPKIEGLEAVKLAGPATAEIAQNVRDAGEAMGAFDRASQQAKQAGEELAAVMQYGLTDAISGALGQLLTFQGSFGDILDNLAGAIQRIVASLVAAIAKQIILNGLAWEEVKARMAAAAAALGPAGLVIGGAALVYGGLKSLGVFGGGGRNQPDPAPVRVRVDGGIIPSGAIALSNREGNAVGGRLGY